MSNPPIADHIGPHYVLKMTNTRREDGKGTPNHLYLVGPFPDRATAGAWGLDPANNPTDSPLWQVVALRDPAASLAVFAPDRAQYGGASDAQVGRWIAEGLQDFPLPAGDRPAYALGLSTSPSTDIPEGMRQIMADNSRALDESAKTPRDDNGGVEDV